MDRWTANVRREVLPNGLTLLAQRIPGPAVAVVTAVRAGFFDEPDRLAGVSHILEHMLFKGTPTRGVGEIARETRAAGGSLNAGTGYDHTSYITVLPPAALRVGLELQSDAVRRSTLDQEELRRELVVIIEEAKRKLDSPAAVTAETLHALLFAQHRIRRWRIGTEAQLGRVTREDVAEFHRRYYVPGETVVAMTGELLPDQACEAAREYFEDWTPTPSQRDPSPAEPPGKQVQARTIRGDVTRADLALGWRTVDRFHPDAIPLDLASMVLSSGRASWLYQRVRVPGAMTAVSASHFTPREVGVFSISGELDPERLPDALGRIAECMTTLGKVGPDPTDLTRVRTMLTASWARRLESAEGRATALASAELDGDYQLLDEDYSKLQSASAEDIRRVAREWLDPQGICGVLYLPEQTGEDLTAEKLREVFSRPS
jgi:zinc protease